MSAAAYAKIREIGAPVITTGEAAAALRVSESSASRTLRSLSARGLLRKIRAGLWAIDGAARDPRAFAAELTRPFPAYVSFQSALAARGVIDQIPREFTLASLGKSKHVRTSVGAFRVHHLPAYLFGDFEQHDGFGLATSEKAVFDYFYVACASGHPDRRLPELDLPADFSEERLRSWVARVNSPRLRKLVETAVERALEHAEHEDEPPRSSRSSK